MIYKIYENIFDAESKSGFFGIKEARSKTGL